MDRIRLLTTLTDYFDRAEVATLCFHIGTSVDDIRGDSRPEKVRELVMWAERTGQVPRLVEGIRLMKRDHPAVWESLFSSDRGNSDHPTPYLGLQPFGEADAAYFFGRAALVAELVQRVSAAPLLAVLGPSGSGKSSAVMAGLVPALRKGALPGSERWHYATLRPGPRPLDTLAATLTQLQGKDALQTLAFRTALGTNERTLLMQAEMLRASHANRRLVLVVDQFEELWTQAPTDPEKQRTFAETERMPFLRLLLAATNQEGRIAQTDAPLLVILTMRADFLGRAAEIAALAQAIQQHLVIVSPMSRTELREAIEKPASLAGVTLESGLVPQMLDAVAEQPGALPLLQHTLLELWKLRQQNTLTRTAYDALGGVAGALAARADALRHQHYIGEKRDVLRHLLLRLVQPGEGVVDIRRRALLREVVPDGSTPAEVQALLHPLVQERLLTTGRDPATGEETIDLSHESLIRAWPTLRQWLDEGRNDLRLHRQLEADAREWQSHHEEPDLLWGALRLAKVEAWQARATPALSTSERRFLEASRHYMDARQRERADLIAAHTQAEHKAHREAEARRAMARRAAVGLMGLLLLVCFLGGLTFNTRSEVILANTIAAEAMKTVSEVIKQVNDANEREIRATQRLEMVAHAGHAFTLLEERKPERAMHHLVYALSLVTDTYPIHLADALHKTAPHSPLWRVLELEHGVVRAMAWRPDGQWVALGSDEGITQVWDVERQHLLYTLRGHRDRIKAVAWSADGTRLVTGSADGSARVWDARQGKLVHTLAEHSGTVLAVAWSLDGSRIATGSADKSVRIWDSRSGRLLHTLSDHSAWVTAVAWSPDGKQIATGSNDGLALVWTLSQAPEPPSAFRAHEGGVWALTWSPSGQRFATGGADGLVHVWDASTADAPNQVLIQTLRHQSAIRMVEWGATERQLMTSSSGGIAHLWDIANEEKVHTVVAGQPTLAAAWSSDGKKVILITSDGKARVWVVANLGRRTLNHPLAVRVAVWSPDGQWIATGSNNTYAYLWDAASQRVVHLLKGHSAEVRAVAWRPDSQQLLTVSQDGTRLWDVGSGQLIRTFAEPEAVRAVAWSPDGEQFVTGSADGNIRLWDAAQGVLLLMVANQGGTIEAVAWSRDGQLIATGSEDGRIRVWAAKGGQLLQNLNGRHESVVSLAWHPDSQTLATAHQDGTIQLWEVSGRLRRSLEGHNGAVRAVAWHPSGELLLTAGLDGTARLWDATNGKQLRMLEEHHIPLSSAGWDPDGLQIVMASEDGKVRLWLVSDQLVAADLVRRTCTLFTDEEIRDTVTTWQNHCPDLLTEMKKDLEMYDQVLGLNTWLR